MIFNIGFERGFLQFEPNPTHSLGFLYGPLFFSYALSLERKAFKIRLRHFIHLLPFLLVLFFSKASPLFRPTYAGIGIMTSVIGYLSATLQSVLRYRKIVRHTQSRYSSISLKWLTDFVIFLAIIAILDIAQRIMASRFGIDESMLFLVVMVSLLIMVNYLVFQTLKYPELFSGISEEDEQIANASERKYASTPIGDTELDQHAHDIRLFFEVETPYLDAELTLDGLSELLGLSARVISQTINSRYGQNFSEFVNEFRVKKAIETFEHNQDKKQTVSEVLYAVGFNSKSSFYAAFKQHTGLSPNQYKQKFLGNPS